MNIPTKYGLIWYSTSILGSWNSQWFFLGLSLFMNWTSLLTSIVKRRLWAQLTWGLQPPWKNELYILIDHHWNGNSTTASELKWMLFDAHIRCFWVNHFDVFFPAQCTTKGWFKIGRDQWFLDHYPIFDAYPRWHVSLADVSNPFKSLSPCLWGSLVFLLFDWS